ncbi:MAG: hypothetical protein PVF96_03005 [Candidatus Bathyarchaeota archaeon]
MSQEKTKLNTCPECKIRDNDLNKKILYQCSFCNRWFCVKHFDPKLAVMKNYKTRVKDKTLKSIIEGDWRRNDGHPDFNYSLERLREYETEKVMDRRLIESILDRSKAHGKGKARYKFTERNSHHARERNPEKKTRKGQTKISAKAKIMAIFLISLIIVGIVIIGLNNLLTR